ncbi:hypothetical protein JB92DRAFT_2990419 [Gautieria morchelliformis]|nr:hypothetical protein JB92DRAFT_2990419 [Gautieria morchelliformis]
MSEYTNSQRRRQTCPPEGLSSQSSSSHTRAASFPQAESSNLRMSKHQHPVHPMHKATTSASSAMSLPPARRHTTPITTSPGKARINALLETIDHAGPFASHDVLPSSSSTTTAGCKAASCSRFAIRKDQEDETRSRPPRLRKPLALGMRVAAVQHARSIISPSHAASMVPGTASTSQNSLPNSGKNTLGSAVTASPASAASSQDPNGYDNGTQTNKSSSGRQRKGKGYRPATPSSSPSFLKPGWASIDGDLEMVSEGEDDAEEEPRSANRGNCSSTPLSLAGTGEEEGDETHLSDGASSSSYGDIDIDPAALEDACKMYDA